MCSCARSKTSFYFGSVFTRLRPLIGFTMYTYGGKSCVYNSSYTCKWMMIKLSQMVELGMLFCKKQSTFFSRCLVYKQWTSENKCKDNKCTSWTQICIGFKTFGNQNNSCFNFNWYQINAKYMPLSIYKINYRHMAKWPKILYTR